MKRTVVVVLAVAVLGSCAPSFSLVEPGRRQIADLYTVEPQIAWSSMTEDKVEFWTVDGAGLEAVRFITGLSEGDSLYTPKATKNKDADVPRAYDGERDHGVRR